MIDLDGSRHSLACNLNATETGKFDVCICGLTAARPQERTSNKQNQKSAVLSARWIERETMDIEIEDEPRESASDLVTEARALLTTCAPGGKITNGADAYLWPNGVVCPTCKGQENITNRKRPGFYRCNACRLDFTVRTGTIFERSHIPLHKWVYGMYLLVTARKGISSMQLAKEIGITQKSAWFMLHRLREACGKDIDKLRGFVEVDETFIGGKEINKHQNKKLNQGRGAVGKMAVLGMRERGGNTKAFTIETNDLPTIQQAIHDNVEVGSTLYTDEHGSYSGIGGLFFRHQTVNHGAGVFGRGPVNTNSIESVWAVLKRGLTGVYHHASPKHLGRYVDEFTFRLNVGNVKIHTLVRLGSFIDAVAGRRLTYKELTA